MPARPPDPAVDIAILGAGPVGCAAALALRGSRHAIRICDAGPPPGGFRPIALSHASRLILERLGAWNAIASTPIETVEVSQRGAFPRTRLEAAEAGVPALGYVVNYAHLARALRETLATSAIAIDPGRASARCTVHAEGVSSEARETRYDQDAVVGLVAVEGAGRSVAYERFTDEGPLALLPAEGRHALIWSMRPERAARLCAADDATFLRQLAEHLGARIGRPVSVQGRALQPLSLRVRSARYGARAVYIGNAAQALHPVAGQGLNLGLRDAWDLAQFLRDAPDPGADEVLARFAASRRMDAFATIGITDALARRTGWGRAAAMCALNALPPARRFFARRMIYGPSALP
jgi:2-octaprenyl-6-methoxyphenol hydroxylase